MAPRVERSSAFAIDERDAAKPPVDQRSRTRSHGLVRTLCGKLSRLNSGRSHGAARHLGDFFDAAELQLYGLKLGRRGVGPWHTKCTSRNQPGLLKNLRPPADQTL